LSEISPIILAVENNDRFTMHASSSNMTGFGRMETHTIQAPESEIWNRLEWPVKTMTVPSLQTAWLSCQHESHCSFAAHYSGTDANEPQWPLGAKDIKG